VSAGIPCLGIEPTDSTAETAETLGIEVEREFFGSAFAEKLVADRKQADLIVANNVFAHVPDIDDFTAGLKAALKPGGTVTLEFPHLLNLIRLNQFDTVYHEHYSYLSLHTVQQIFEKAGLIVYDVERLPTHGGSLRLYGCHIQEANAINANVDSVLADEINAGLQELGTYLVFQSKADRAKDDLLSFLISQKHQGKTIAAYGAAAKGNTLLNYAGVKSDLLPFVCDAALSKQGKYMPGSHIPILPPTALSDHRIGYVLILPWNIAAEIKQQNARLAALGTKFVTAIPKLTVCS